MRIYEQKVALNNFDNFLKFTCEEMSNDSLVYLDTKVICKDEILELEQNRKTTKLDFRSMRVIKSTSV